MNNILRNKYLKIVLLLGVAFVISDFSVKNVFLANSPKINPYAGQNMIAKINSTWSKATSLVAFKNPNKSSGLIEDLPKTTLDAMKAPLNKISQGVYAGERNNIQVYEIKSNEIEYLVYTFTINGKETKIKVPKDQQPPSQEQMEALYK
jgi:hypothetical protein